MLTVKAKKQQLENLEKTQTTKFKITILILWQNVVFLCFVLFFPPSLCSSSTWLNDQDLYYCLQSHFSI